MFDKSRLQRRGSVLRWDIDADDYALLQAEPCWYCGGPLPTAGVGLDRFDELQGYALDNVAPCCWCCNTARGVYTPTEFRRMFETWRQRYGEFRWPSRKTVGKRTWSREVLGLRKALDAIALEFIDHGELEVRRLLTVQPAFRRRPNEVLLATPYLLLAQACQASDLATVAGRVG